MPSASVRLALQLRAGTALASSIPVTAETVEDALGAIAAQYPELRAKLFEGTRVRPGLNLYVNNDDVRYRSGVRTPLSDGDEVVVLTAAHGG